MGVRVVTSVWSDSKQDNLVQEHVYENATTWTISSYGTRSDINYLEVIGPDEQDDDRVVAMFRHFDRVEVIDPVDEEE